MRFPNILPIHDPPIIMITLEEITPENIHAVLALSVSEAQRTYYPQSNAYSIAEGMFPPDDDPVWIRAICKNGSPVGFMMTSEIPEQGEYFLWRMMIDQHSQGKGLGVQAMKLLIKRVIDNGNPQTLLLSHLKSNTAASRFYSGLGFAYTDEVLGKDDLMMKLSFDQNQNSWQV